MGLTQQPVKLGRHLGPRHGSTLGADPEMFVFSGEKLVPAYKFLPPKGHGALMYWDGFQAEWKYNHEANYCLNNLVKHTRESLMRLNDQAKEHNSKARLSLVNVVRVPDKLLETADTPHVELGCEPSFNAYNLEGLRVGNPRKLKYRFAGGHMHFGTWERRKPRYVPIIKTLDKVLGVFAVGVARHMDNPIRRQYYGMPGEFRPPKYGMGLGVEYRTLSNFWLASPATMQLVWDLGRVCVRLSGSKNSALWASSEQETIDVIKNCDYVQATQILKRNEPMMKWLLGHCYRKPETIQEALNIGYEGVEIKVPDTEAIAENWHFKDEWEEDATAPWARFESWNYEEGYGH